MNNKEKAEEYFKNDIFATDTTRIKIDDAYENYSKCSLKIEDCHLNAMGYVMGGAIFTLADFAFAVATNSDSVSTVSLNSNINFISSAKCQYLFAEAKSKKIGKNICFYTITITNENMKLIATVDTTGYISYK